MLKLVYTFLLLYMLPLPVFAGQPEMKQLEQEVIELERQYNQYTDALEQVTKKVNKLAGKIENYKAKESLNVFQRRRLEGYLKTSQQLSNDLESKQKSLNSIKRKLEINWKTLIRFYDKEITTVMQAFRNDSLENDRKKSLLAYLAQIKEKRETLQAKLELVIEEPLNMDQLDFSDLTDIRQIKEKADWLKDQEEKLRKNIGELKHIINNLKEEIEIREKMLEFRQDISFFNHQDETLNPQMAESRSAEKNGIQTDFRDNNAFLDTEDLSKSSLLPLFPEITVGKDAANLTNLDIQTFIRGLEERKARLLSAADSLKLKANELYRKAEKLGK